MQAIDNDGTQRMIEMFDQRKMEKHLADPAVKEVRVFNLKKGMTVNIQNTLYKITAVRPSGKITMRPK